MRPPNVGAEASAHPGHVIFRQMKSASPGPYQWHARSDNLPLPWGHRFETMPGSDNQQDPHIAGIL